jgi:phage gp46-like protein
MAEQINIIDVLIHESGDGGELQLRNEDLQISQALTNQIYLTLYGGNIEENTSDDLEEKERRQDFWGNYYLEEEEQFNSNFERELKNQPLTANGLSRLEDAASQDLQFLSDYADIDVSASIPKPYKLELTVTLTQPDSESVKVKFVWDSQRKEFYQEKII